MTENECNKFISTLSNSISDKDKIAVERIIKQIQNRFFGKTENIEKTEIKFSDEQLKAINSKEKYILLKARAGSGKTSVLVERVKQLLKSGVSQNEILVLAFNKKASQEIKNRIGGTFQNSKTFHSFAWNIIKPEKVIFGRKQLEFLQNIILEEKGNFPNIDFHTIGNDEISQKKYNFSKEKFYKYIRNRSDISLNGDEVKSKGESWIADFLFEHNISFEYEKKYLWNGKSYNPDFTILSNIILEHWGIDENQKNGKTPDDWTKTFSEYKIEMNRKREFLKNSDEIFIETSIVDLKNGRENFEKILKSKLEKTNLKFSKLSEKKIIEKMNFTKILKTTEQVNSFISNAKQRSLSIQDLKKKGGQTQFIKFAISIFEKYEESREIDFLDLLNLAIQKISKNDISKLKYILIDEFQDFSPLFYKLIEKIRDFNPKINIFAVGDDWQGINGFAGSDLEYFNNFQTYFPKAQILSMVTNHRSLSKIVDYGNSILDGQKAVSTQDGGEIINISSFPTKFPQGKTVGIIVRSNYEKTKIPFINGFENIEILTAHKSKGLEFDIVLIFDKSSFQKYKENPINDFFEKTKQDILEEEKRLFYVAVTRAKEKLYIL